MVRMEDEASVKEDRPRHMQPSIDNWVKCVIEEVHNKGDSQSQSQYSHHQRRQQQPLCIYKVPAWFKALHARAYEPHAVSLGPYHYANPNLKPMEKHKHRALLTFLRRAKENKLNETEPLVAIKEAMKAVVEQLKSSYEELDDLSRYLDSKETKEQNPQLSLEDHFLQLMIVDGCFVLEVLRVATAGEKEPTGYEDTDPVFSNHGKDYMMGHLERDMLMLENQLPMLALTTIADASQIGLQKKRLIEQIRTFYDLMDISSRTSSDDSLHRTPSDDSLHILHEYIKCKTQIGDYSPSNGHMIWSAMELHEGGVKFSKSESDSFKDISFNRSKGVLSLPLIEVEDSTEAVLLNLMAFEHLHVGAGNAVTAYVSLMDTLIDSARDVELLRTKDIVKGLVGSDENVAKIFNRISDETVIIITYNKNGVDNQLSEYRNNKLNRWRASFVHTYLRNPWVFFSLLSALILLFLTLLQDVYTVLPYYTK